MWFAATPGGDRPVLVLTRDPVAERIGAVVVAALTRTVRGLVSELELTPGEDGVPTHCVPGTPRCFLAAARLRAGDALRPRRICTVGVRDLGHEFG